jgi:hypothetical protein
MFINKSIGSIISGFSLSVLLGMTMLPQAIAADLGDPAQVVDDYLVSLSNGDIDGVLARIDGRMKSKNRALELSPESYSEFLRGHYAGVETTTEEITPQGDKILARVRFDYPTSDSSVIVFVLTQTDGQWKITNEEY